MLKQNPNSAAFLFIDIINSSLIFLYDYIWLHLINVSNLHFKTQLLKGPFNTTKLNYHHCKWQILREWTSSDFPCQFLPLCQCMYCHTQVFSHILCINYIWALIPQCGKIQFEIDFEFLSAYFSHSKLDLVGDTAISQ